MKVKKFILFALCLTLILTTNTASIKNHKKKIIKSHTIIHKVNIKFTPFVVRDVPAQNTVVSSETVSKQTEVANTNSNTRNYSDEDLYWLSHVVSAETKDLSDKAQIYCASVVLNRVNKQSNEFGKTIKQVVTKHGQYQTYSNGKVYNDPSQRAINNAKYVLDNNSQIPSGVIYQSESKLGKLFQKVDTEYFCFG